MSSIKEIAVFPKPRDQQPSFFLMLLILARRNQTKTKGIASTPCHSLDATFSMPKTVLHPSCQAKPQSILQENTQTSVTKCVSSLLDKGDLLY